MPLPADHELDGHLFGSEQSCFGCGPTNPLGFRLKFERDGEAVVTRFTPMAHHQGAPGIMHGGLVSTLADELAAWTVVAQRGRFGFTASFSCKFKQPVRVARPLLARGVIAQDRRRIFNIQVDVEQDDIQCYRGDFVFVVFDEQGVERMLRQPVPESWKRFTRR